MYFILFNEYSHKTVHMLYHFQDKVWIFVWFLWLFPLSTTVQQFYCNLIKESDILYNVQWYANKLRKVWNVFCDTFEQYDKIGYFFRIFMEMHYIFQHYDILKVVS